MHTKIRQAYEPRLVTEYVSQTWPDATVLYDVPLGPVPQNLAQKVGEAQAARIARTARPRADAIIVLPSEIVLLEGKIMDVNQGLGMLYLYKLALPQTPELQQYLTSDTYIAAHIDMDTGNLTAKYATKPIRMMLVAANPPEWATTICDHTDIEVVQFCPSWATEYMAWRNREGTKARLHARAKRKATLEALGFQEGAG
jgi:hypothetical protein